MYIKQAIVSILMVVITFVAIRSCLPESTNLGNSNHDISEQKIIIIPVAGIPPLFLQQLENKLEKLHNTDVLITTVMGTGTEILIPGSDQYNANYLASKGIEIGKRIGRDNSFIVVLTNEDINIPKSGLRYVYSAHYDGVSVTSLARINDMNHGVIPKLIEIPGMFLKMQQRALKIINKAIGYGVYGYKTSSDINSVMYGPIMGPQDLDRVGNWYE